VHVLVEPTREQILAFCAEEPVERVFLEDVARRGFGRFVALVDDEGRLEALAHVGTNFVPTGNGCRLFAEQLAHSGSRMIIGDERAVDDLWSQAAGLLEPPREDRPGQPVYAIFDPPAPGESGLRAATLDDIDDLVPRCARAHEEELGVDPLRRDSDGFRWRTRAQIEDGRSWLWIEDGVVLFKAEASAWTPHAVQVQQVWVDPEARGRGFGARGLRDLCRLLLEEVPAVTLFVRTDNPRAIALYESVGMVRAGTYRSLLF
jgi:hypothetical protein